MQANPKVSLAFWGEDGAYQLHGTARYVNEGEEFAELKKWADASFAAMGASIVAKGGCLVHVDSVYQMSPGPAAGNRLA